MSVVAAGAIPEAIKLSGQFGCCSDTSHPALDNTRHVHSLIKAGDEDLWQYLTTVTLAGTAGTAWNCCRWDENYLWVFYYCHCYWGRYFHIQLISLILPNNRLIKFIFTLKATYYFIFIMYVKYGCKCLRQREKVDHDKLDNSWAWGLMLKITILWKVFFFGNSVATSNMSDWSTVVSQFRNIVYQAGLRVKSDPDNRIKARWRTKQGGNENRSQPRYRITSKSF